MIPDGLSVPRYRCQIYPITPAVRALSERSFSHEESVEYGKRRTPWARLSEAKPLSDSVVASIYFTTCNPGGPIHPT